MLSSKFAKATAVTVLLLLGLGASPHGWTDLGPAYHPPACTVEGCPMYGPGGYVEEWEMHARKANLLGKTLVVGAGRVCASACAIAVGVVLKFGNVRIAQSATFVPHEMRIVRAKASMMPRAFRKKMLAGKPFHYSLREEFIGASQ